MTEQNQDSVDEIEMIDETLPESEYLGVALGHPGDLRAVAARLMIFEKKRVDARAQVAVEFISKWGMVAAMPDGEDSAGRQKLRLATESELVMRAISTVGLLFSSLEDMGWVVDLPDLNALMDADDAEQDEPLTGDMTPATEPESTPEAGEVAADGPVVDGVVAAAVVMAATAAVVVESAPASAPEQAVAGNHASPGRRSGKPTGEQRCSNATVKPSPSWLLSLRR
jgi:hypothetical protein